MTIVPARSGTGSGTPGADGESAYQLAVDQGFSGTLSQWLASLVGPQGQKGDKGDPGASGTGGTALALDAPQHPLAFRTVGTRGGNLSSAALSDGTVTGSNTHRLVDFPYACGRLGVLCGNYYCNSGPEGARDNRGPNAITLKVGVGDATSGSVPLRAYAFLHFQQDAGQAKYLDGDQATFSLPGADGVIFDTGQAVAAGAQKYVNVFCQVASGEKFPVHTTLPRTGDKATTSAGETDKSLSTPTSLGTNGLNGFDFLALVDLEKLQSGVAWQACLVGGDSLNGGNYGAQVALLSAGVPFVTVARGMEQAQEWLDYEAKTVYRRSQVSRPLATFAYWQILTNDAALSDGETFSGSGSTSWQQKQRDLVRWLRRRGITRVAWATLPPETASLDSWASRAGQYLNMTTRGPRQQLMQDWNAYLRAGTLLYTDPVGWRLYAAPAGRGFGAGSVVGDVWPPLTILEPVDTATVTAGAGSPAATAGYDFGGAPIMKWWNAGVAAALTGDGLHPGSTAGKTLHAAGVTGVLQYMAANG